MTSQPKPLTDEPLSDAQIENLRRIPFSIWSHQDGLRLIATIEAKDKMLAETRIEDDNAASLLNVLLDAPEAQSPEQKDYVRQWLDRHRARTAKDGGRG